MIVRLAPTLALGLAILAGCAQQEEPQPISTQPTFNKMGVPSCRPYDVPVGGIYTSDLPICPVIAAPGMAPVAYVDGDDGMAASATPGTSPGVVPPPEPSGPPYNNQNTNQNQNQVQTGGA